MSVERDVIRRLLVTGRYDPICAAPLVMERGAIGSGDWYNWDYCNEAPGHVGPHLVHDDDGGLWAEWDDDALSLPRSDYRRPEGVKRPYRNPGSPWTVEEIVVLDEIANRA